MKKYFLGFLGLVGYGAVAFASTSTRLADAKALGWLPSDNVCGGYFVTENDPKGSLQDSPVTITVDNASLSPKGISSVSGNVRVSQPGRMIIGNKADVDIDNRWYQISDVIYRLFVGNSLSAWGRSSQVTQPPSNITELKDIIYSTCPPQSRAWHLKAQSLALNQDTGRGEAYNTVLYAQDVPIFYTPYFSFPIDSRRQTGFLYPKFSFGSTSGLGFGTPFYWNIAPNVDDTVTPYFYTKRGFQFNNQYRYLTKTSNGVFNISVLPNDWEFRQFQATEPFAVPANTPGVNDLEEANPMRSFFSWTHHSQFNENWSGVINYSRVSDDYYSQDLGGVPLIAQNQLLQQGQLLYLNDDFSFLTNFQGFQTLHPINQAFVSNQYNMLPQLLFSSRFIPKANTLNFQWTAEAVNFTKSPNPGQLDTPPSGQRLNIVPTISYPLTNVAGFFTPKVAYELTQYNIGDQLVNAPNEITRALPLFNVDSGLYFQRDVSYFNHGYTQTLEPRIFYLYVPYRNQQDIPLFDSSLQPFSFNQLFLMNRFAGSDRIGDANQMSMALTTRYLDNQTGDEKFSAGAGIIKYFQTRQVTLCQTQGCQDSPYSVGSGSLSSAVSPAVGLLQYHFNPQWNASLNGAWDPVSAKMQNSTVNFQYMPLPNHIFNLGYTYVRHGDFFTLPANSMVTQPQQDSSKYDLSEPTTSFAWPLSDRWNVLGSFSYSLNQNHALTYFGGVEYNTCCWALQVVLAKNFSGFDAFAVPQYNTGVYVQWVFKGLAKVAANDPTALLLTNIPGYQDTFSAL